MTGVQTCALPISEFYSVGDSRHYFEVFNRGQAPLEYSVEVGAPWVRVELDPACTEQLGQLEKEQRLWVSIDWSQVAAGVAEVPITVSGPGGQQVKVQVVVHQRPLPADFGGFAEANGYVSLEAEHFTHAVAAEPIRWQRIPGLGRTFSGMMPTPVTAESQTPSGESPRLEYRMYLSTAGPVTVMNRDRKSVV